MIPFNRPYITGNELKYISDVILSGKLSGNGKYSEKCLNLLEKKYGFKNSFLTSSGSQALEIIALLLDLKKGDEIIIPSLTYVTTANVFASRGINLVFADSYFFNPNVNPACIEKLITKKTRAVIIMHYGGISCDLGQIKKITSEKKIVLIEDAALGLDAYYRKKPLGTFGDFGIYSFHDTKNITSGEGGLLIVNNKKFLKRAEIIYENGTNRADFKKGKVNKYEWVDFGSSYYMSELNAAFLFAQLEKIHIIQKKRKDIWNYFYNKLKGLTEIKPDILPFIPAYAEQNYQLFYLLCSSAGERDNFMKHMMKKSVHCHFHYQSLHRSEFIKKYSRKISLENSEMFSDCLIRIPLYPDLTKKDCDLILNETINFFTKYESGCYTGNQNEKFSSNKKYIRK